MIKSVSFLIWIPSFCKQEFWCSSGWCTGNTGGKSMWNYTPSSGLDSHFFEVRLATQSLQPQGIKINVPFPPDTHKGLQWISVNPLNTYSITLHMACVLFSFEKPLKLTVQRISEVTGRVPIDFNRSWITALTQWSWGFNWLHLFPSIFYTQWRILQTNKKTCRIFYLITDREGQQKKRITTLKNQLWTSN